MRFGQSLKIPHLARTPACAGCVAGALRTLQLYQDVQKILSFLQGKRKVLVPHESLAGESNGLGTKCHTPNSTGAGSESETAH